ncbi:MAG: hypothetical protein LBU24_02125 [Methanocalculaceae archaeon]|jgi:hypothetical protein|nr:hypothetical protein [Methanocalculaceae archaeon]
MDEIGRAIFQAGIVLFIVGVILLWYFLPSVILVLLGGIGIVFALAGVAMSVLGYFLIKE